MMISVVLWGLLICAGCGSAPSAGYTAEERSAAAAAEEDVHSAVSEETDQTIENSGHADDPAIMSYPSFLEAEEDSPVTIEAYVQAKEALRNGYCCLYVQNEEGAFYLPRMHCSQEEFDSLEIGRKIRVNGYKSHWNDSLEISDATIQMIDGSWIAEAKNVTSLIGTEELIQHQNEKVCFHGMTVETMPDGHSVWYSGWDNTAPEGEDSELYFRASHEGTICDFTVKPSLCQNVQDVLHTLQALQSGDTVDLTGFLRFYNGALPRITEITLTDGNLTEPS